MDKRGFFLGGFLIGALDFFLLVDLHDCIPGLQHEHPRAWLRPISEFQRRNLTVSAPILLRDVTALEVAGSIFGISVHGVVDRQDGQPLAYRYQFDVLLLFSVPSDQKRQLSWSQRGSCTSR